MIASQLNKDIIHTLSALSCDEKSKLKDAIILITGACGFLGYYFMHFFQQTSSELGIKKIIAIDNFLLGKPAWLDKFINDPVFIIEQFDIIYDDIKNIMFASSANYIIHMASIASPVYYRKYPIETMDANIWGLRKLFDFYKEKKIKGFLFFSSSEIYGDPDNKNIPTKEEYFGNVSITGPRACYDESKRFGETMCMLFSLQYNLPIGVARPFNNFGPGMKLNDKRVPADFALAIYEGRDIYILSNGFPTRTFCYIADSINGYLKILLHGRYDYFNIGMEKPEININELAENYIIAGKEIFGYEGKIKYKVSSEKHYLTNNPQRRCPDISKARNILGYNPVINVQEGIKRFLNYLKETEKNEYFW